MRLRPQPVAGVALVALTIAMWPMRPEAHKPITSPYTFSDDVLPIVKERCAECHSPGGVAPMSLLTHADAVPWGESIRVELMAGHMPPWGVDSAAARFRNLQQFPAREMNVLLTWASGGTPAGTPVTAAATAYTPQWSLGQPDAILPLPEVTMAAEAQERVEEFVLDAPARHLRAVDLLPGTPSIVRRATVTVRAATDARAAGATPERLVALWLPGDHPVPLDAGIGFQVPATAKLVVRVYYRKTWQRERDVVMDRSTVGLYFADADATGVQVLRAFTPAASGPRASFATTVNEDVRALALYADPDLSGANVTVVVVKPDGSRDELIAFRPRAEWARRYWFREPITLSRGTQIQVTADLDEGQLLPPAATHPVRESPERSSLSLALDVIRGR
jgi:hypothetical protein